MIQRRWHWRNRKNMLQITTEARFHLGVPGTACCWFLVVHPPKTPLLSMSPTLYLVCKNRKSRYVGLKEPDLSSYPQTERPEYCRGRCMPFLDKNLKWWGIHKVAYLNKCNSPFYRLHCLIYLSLHLEQEGDNQEIGSFINCVFSVYCC